MDRTRSALTLLSALALTLVAVTPASADPGDRQKTGSVFISETQRLDPQGGRLLPSTDRIDDLGGGVYATSSVGMQWGASWSGEDVQGRTASQTNVSIDEINASGSLIQHGDANAQNCYAGTVVWPISYTRFSTYVADTGWGPIYRGFHDCWVMATSHYYIVSGARTDISGPDYLRRF